jgi:hypothetical protein
LWWRGYVFDIVEALHKALRIESTLAFVLIIGLGAGLIGAFLAWVIDTGYKNSEEYKIVHANKDSQKAVVKTDVVTAPSTSPSAVQSHSEVPDHHPSKEPIPHPMQAVAPYGIAITGGNVSNPTVNNFGPAKRILTQEQREKFIASLRPNCPLEIAVRALPGNQESMEYAEQIAEAIRDAGCRLKRPKFLIDTAPSYGLQVFIYDKDKVPTAADSLAGALNAAGLKWTGLAVDMIEPDSTYLMVGLSDFKPL